MRGSNQSTVAIGLLAPDCPDLRLDFGELGGQLFLFGDEGSRLRAELFKPFYQSVEPRNLNLIETSADGAAVACLVGLFANRPETFLTLVVTATGALHGGAFSRLCLVRPLRQHKPGSPTYKNAFRGCSLPRNYRGEMLWQTGCDERRSTQGYFPEKPANLLGRGLIRLRGDAPIGHGGVALR